MDGLNNKELFITVLEVEKSKIKVLADLMSGKGPLTWQRGRKIAHISSYKGTNLIYKGSTLMI